MILHFYFARRFAMTFLGLAVVLYSMIAVVDMIDLLRDFEGHDVSFGQVAGLMLLKSPNAIDEILPLILLLATITLFVRFARTSELVVTRAAGRSALRALIAPTVVAFTIGVVAVTTLGPVVSASNQRFEILSEAYKSEGGAALSVSAEGLWLRQGGTDGQMVIRASRSNADGSVLFDVTFLRFTETGRPEQRVEAKSATLQGDSWIMRDAKIWTLEGSDNPESEAQTHTELALPATLTLDRIRDTLGRSSGVSIWEMPTFITQLESAGFSARQHHVWLQSEYSRPLLLMAMVLVGAAFTMRHTRLGGTGVAVLSSILLGFTLYFAHRFSLILGENAQLSILVAAWAVPVASVLLALGLLLHTEDG